jgi:hypothetical protein
MTLLRMELERARTAAELEQIRAALNELRAGEPRERDAHVAGTQPAHTLGS